jgi:mono/diheme cytochrome c family protein
MHELPASQRWAVIQFLKTFSDRWAKEPAGRPIAVPPEPPVTPASIEKGDTLFQTNCALCHGEQGRADGALSQPGMLGMTGASRSGRLICRSRPVRRVV